MDDDDDDDDDDDNNNSNRYVGLKRINGIADSAWNFHGLIRRKAILETGYPILSTALSDVSLKEMDFCCIRVKTFPEASVGFCATPQRTTYSLDKVTGSVPQHDARDSALGVRVIQGGGDANPHKEW